jgi:hypothetical protein
MPAMLNDHVDASPALNGARLPMVPCAHCQSFPTALPMINGEAPRLPVAVSDLLSRHVEPSMVNK